MDFHHTHRKYLFLPLTRFWAFCCLIVILVSSITFVVCTVKEGKSNDHSKTNTESPRR